MTIWRMRIACWIPKGTNNKGYTKASQCYVIPMCTLPVFFNSVCVGVGGEIGFRPGILRNVSTKFL
jgi:hypothetical protein